jgi:hypothetical protein
LDHLIDHTSINGLATTASTMHSGDEQRRLREHHSAPNAGPFCLFNRAASASSQTIAGFVLDPPRASACVTPVAAMRWLTPSADAVTLSRRSATNDQATPPEQTITHARSELEIFAALAPATLSSSMS